MDVRIDTSYTRKHDSAIKTSRPSATRIMDIYDTLAVTNFYDIVQTHQQ